MSKARKTQSSSTWLNRSSNDVFSKLAKQNNLRSRAFYKLNDVDKKYAVTKKANIILDLGSFPGSWLQYIKQNTKNNRKIIGVDLKEIEAIEGVTFIKGDFLSAEVKVQLEEIFNSYNQKIDLICSDMAPYATGNRATNHILIMNLAESSFEFSKQFLNTGGNLVIKLFEGNRTKLFYNKLKEHFETVHFFKPDASHSDSSEIFIIAKSFRKI
ncbi:MAG: 23S rRNA (uridine2552-2'-O)-methyltransferase [Candidatus Midichloriaceae bacterium]